MLGYVLDKMSFKDDTTVILYDAISVETPLLSNIAQVRIYYSDDECPVEVGRPITVKSQVKYFDTLSDTDEYAYFDKTYDVNSVNIEEKYFSIAVNAYNKIDLNSFYEVTFSDGRKEWEFKFSPTHYQKSEDNIALYITTKSRTYILTNCNVKTSNKLYWTYDPDMPGIDSLRNILINKHFNGTKFEVEQFLFSDTSDNNSVTNEFTINKYLTNINVPILTEQTTGLYIEDNVNEYFFKDISNNAINPIVDMERISYSPMAISKTTNDNVTTMHILL